MEKSRVQEMETTPSSNSKQLQQPNQFQETQLETGCLESYHLILCSVLAMRSSEHHFKSHIFFFPFFLNHSLNS